MAKAPAREEEPYKKLAEKLAKADDRESESIYVSREATHLQKVPYSASA